MSAKYLFVGCAFLVACGAAKAPVDDNFADLAGADEKSDKFTGVMTVVGSSAYGETHGPFQHRAGKWSAVKFVGGAGDQVSVDVKSSNGDTVAWVVDKSMEILAFNDDSSGGTNSHIDTTLPTNATYYIVVRDYYRQAMKFTVTLNGKKAVDYAAPCAVDSDCVLANTGCCGNAFTAVRADLADAFHTSLMCSPGLKCATFFPADQMAECQANKCVAVAAKDIACGGHRVSPRECPPSYVCEGPGLAYDAPGSCVKRCGGIAGLSCDGTDICADDPNDACDPANGGADCMGVCRAAICSGKTAKCAAGYKWSQFDCNCVASDCRASGCDAGSYCSFCWAGFSCIPEGAVC